MKKQESTHKKLKVKSTNCNGQQQIVIPKVHLNHANESQIVDEICKMLKHACSLFEKRDKELKTSEKIINEWRELAKRFDSILLWIFLIVFSIMSTMLFMKIFFYETKTVKSICQCSS